MAWDWRGLYGLILGQVWGLVGFCAQRLVGLGKFFHSEMGSDLLLYRLYLLNLHKYHHELELSVQMSKTIGDISHSNHHLLLFGRGLGFSSQHAHSGLHLPLTSVGEITVPSSGLLRHCTHVVHIHTYRQNKHTYIHT